MKAVHCPECGLNNLAEDEKSVCVCCDRGVHIVSEPDGTVVCVHPGCSSKINQDAHLHVELALSPERPKHISNEDCLEGVARTYGAMLSIVGPMCPEHAGEWVIAVLNEVSDAFIEAIAGERIEREFREEWV